MSEAPGSPAAPAPVPYRVSYSELVRNELRDLIARARARGLGRQVLAAVKEIDKRLRIYPQFGQPLQDLELEPGQVWIGTVPPLVVKYVLDEEKRQVTVVVPLTALPDSGL
jgi:hypothetical protein